MLRRAAAEHHGAGPGRRDAQGGDRRPDGILHQLPRLWRAAADGELGQHADQCAGLFRHRALPGDPARRADHASTVMSFNFFGDGLRDAFDARLKMDP